MTVMDPITDMRIKARAAGMSYGEYVRLNEDPVKPREKRVEMPKQMKTIICADCGKEVSVHHLGVKRCRECKMERYHTRNQRAKLRKG